MNVIDKTDVRARIERGDRITLELGCGPSKRDPAAIGIDLLDFPGVDLVGDVYAALAMLPPASVDAIYTAHFLEHLPDLPALLLEAARVLKPAARFTIVVPHFSNPFYYSDPTHRTPFGLYTMAYFCSQTILRRGVPRYGFDLPLALDSVRLEFKSYPPRYVRHAFKRMIGALVNSSIFATEFYEENFCWLVPCYEVRYQLHRN
jgi:SAM-dependent methyltransferase